MAKSLTSLLNQIERLQKEASLIQSEVIDRIRKEIAKYHLTPEQLFGAAVGSGAKRAKPTRKSSTPRVAKYADQAGNSWGGVGKRPEWLRQALAAGKALEDFLVGGAGSQSVAATDAGKPASKRTRKAPSAAKPAVGRKTKATKRAAARKSSKARPRAAAAATSASE
ncbi:H-NS histone family protein [Pelomonas sp. P7]|uniref:H-NS histone family protein n=1 Tax=Pelomonas caseinilytica TaxID=2906763 RepID=A0ABS8XEQ6_9BURK|nr:H-NS histone family protein [Pelomonas sp. P7]MCE4538253.1 H-NS histone family protein [Pelomonas sp. P7]